MKKEVRNILKRISEKIPNAKILFLFASGIITAAILYSIFMLLIVK